MTQPPQYGPPQTPPPGWGPPPGQPNPGGPYGPPPPKKGLGAGAIIAIIGGVILLGLILLVVLVALVVPDDSTTGDKPKAGQKTSAPAKAAPPALSSKPPATKKPAPPAGPVQVSARKTPFAPTILHREGDYTSVKVTVTNNGDKKISVNPLYFSITDSTGEKHGATLGMDEGQIDTVDLAPGEKVTGTVTGKGAWTPAYWGLPAYAGPNERGPPWQCHLRPTKSSKPSAMRG
ncbi:MAG: NdaS [Nonomuraea muscovyensis]|nr:NdaS [Nonomuraea muscovyensis]